MAIDRKAWILTLWVGAITLVLGGFHILGLSDGEIVGFSLTRTIGMGVFLSLAGAYASQEDRLTPARVGAAALALVIIFAMMGYFQHQVGELVGRAS